MKTAQSITQLILTIFQLILLALAILAATHFTAQPEHTTLGISILLYLTLSFILACPSAQDNILSPLHAYALGQTPPPQGTDPILLDPLSLDDLLLILLFPLALLALLTLALTRHLTT